MRWRSTCSATAQSSVSHTSRTAGHSHISYNADDAAPTNSTYTLWNLLFSNTGYHNEHHTFPSVPGCRLPEITAAAPEAFKPTENPTPWAVLWARRR